ncbi:MAG: hypothetical protein L3J88_00475 [Gammaproteobacteria bacterium]|nr:hypothetical protein [Gammaproteobacteria bacterium]MCF6361847.1 hypothetical protein [Gammaproteobacteria bacterium]
MSSPKYATPLVLEPRPSRWLLSLILFSHGGAIAVLLALDEWPWPVRLLLVVVVLASLWFTVGGLGWRRSPTRIQRLIWQTENEWRLELCNGEMLTARLRPSSYMHPWLVVLNLRVEGQWLPCSLVLARDSLDVTTFRRLRVRLTTEAGSLFGGT